MTKCGKVIEREVVGMDVNFCSIFLVPSHMFLLLFSSLVNSVD